MKKSIAKHLNELADKMPIVFNMETETILMSGEELNLTPIGDAYKLEKDKFYEVNMPLFRAVEHKQQLKDAYKRGGLAFVKEYVNSVIS